MLVFGHMRDLGIHHSDLFKYEQYAIVIIIAVERVSNSFKKDFVKIKTKRQSEKKIENANHE